MFGFECFYILKHCSDKGPQNLYSLISWITQCQNIQLYSELCKPGYIDLLAFEVTWYGSSFGLAWPILDQGRSNEQCMLIWPGLFEYRAVRYFFLLHVFVLARWLYNSHKRVSGIEEYGLWNNSKAKVRILLWEYIHHCWDCLIELAQQAWASYHGMICIVDRK